MTRQVLEKPSRGTRRASGVQPIEGDPDEETRIATPRALRRGQPRFKNTQPNAEPIDRRALPFTTTDERREGPISAPPVSSSPSPWRHDGAVNKDALPSSLMPASIRSDPPPAPVPASPVPTRGQTVNAAGRQAGAVVLVAVIALGLLAALAMWQTL